MQGVGGGGGGGASTVSVGGGGLVGGAMVGGIGVFSPPPPPPPSSTVGVAEAMIVSLTVGVAVAVGCRVPRTRVAVGEAVRVAALVVAGGGVKVGVSGGRVVGLGVMVAVGARGVP